MRFSNKKLSEVLEQAFDAGVRGCGDEKDGIVTSLLAACQDDHRFRHYSLVELQRFQAGRKVFHVLKGEGVVVIDAKSFGVLFDDGTTVGFSFQEAEFWSCPLMDLGTSIRWGGLQGKTGLPT